MSQDDFDQRIAAKEANVRAVVDQLEALRKQFLPLVATQVVEWWNATAKREVQQSTSVTEKLTDEQLGELKAQIKNLCAGAEKHVEEFFSDAKPWWHLQSPLVSGEYSSDYFYYLDGNRGPDQITKPLRLVLGKLAPILESFGYLKTDRRTGGRWLEYDASGNYQPPTGRPYYPYSLDWPKEFTPVIEQYSKQVRVAQGLLREVEALRREQKQTAARSRWDGA